MENKIAYSFDDEVVSKFCYDMDNKKIEVHFTGYFDWVKNQYSETNCALIIEDWADAKSQIGDEKRLYRLDKHMGIFSLILSMDSDGKDLKLLVNTIDERYVTMLFIKPRFSLMVF